MSNQNLSHGILHKLPKDLKEAFIADRAVCEAWNSLTPIARNEWICWITHVKKEETRAEHIKRACEDLRKGKRRPCCWPGCLHRNPNAKKYFHKKK